MCYVAARIERRELRGATAADALQYQRRYSTAGTVHGVVAAARARGAGGGRPRGFAHGRQERRDFLLISYLIRLIHLLSLYREV